MKMVTIQVDSETAKRLISDFENKISEMLQERERLNAEILKLDESAKKMREQLHGVNGTTSRQPHGQNTKRIKEYLAKLTDNKGARMSEISKSTGISPSSTSFTLKNYKKYFVREEETGLWKLK